MTEVGAESAEAARAVALLYRQGVDREMLEGFLADLGFEILGGWPDAGGQGRLRPVSLFICDEVEGERRLEELLRLRRDAEGVVTPVLVLAGSESAALRLLHAGFDDALVHPVRKAVLEARVLSLTRLHETSLASVRRNQNLKVLLDAMVGRELRMAELKKVIRSLREQLLAAGIQPAANDPLLEDPGER